MQRGDDALGRKSLRSSHERFARKIRRRDTAGHGGTRPAPLRSRIFRSWILCSRIPWSYFLARAGALTVAGRSL